MTNRQAQAYAISLIATYETDEMGEYERAVVRVARTWLSFLRSKHPVGGVVNRLREELQHDTPPDPGIAWDELRTTFTKWARSTGWIQPWEC
jgi:hypothetical protein